MRMNKSAGGFTVCEDFERLHQLKCVAPEQIQAKRELNRLEQIENPLKAFFKNKLKKGKFYDKTFKFIQRTFEKRN